jgi:ubiquinol-cytochrome c reductase cytochrome c1 subunit
MMRALVAAVALTALLALAPTQNARAQEAASLPTQSWSFAGPFGTFDRAAAQRGFQVYQQVCANCHSLKQAYYRNLAGIGLNEEQIKAIAASVQVPTLNDQGEPAERPALPSDHFKSPFPNALAARAALNGALPPDLSVITKAREGGEDYVYDLLTGYVQPPADVKVGAGLYYDAWFPGHQIAMPPPLQDDSVTYTDGTKATLPQEAHDVVTFLSYIANPEMEERKRLGVKMVLFFTLLAGLTYAVKRKLWAGKH